MFLGIDGFQMWNTNGVGGRRLKGYSEMVQQEQDGFFLPEIF
jgi:hypothetical protein